MQIQLLIKELFCGKDAGGESRPGLLLYGIGCRLSDVSPPQILSFFGPGTSIGCCQKQAEHDSGAREVLCPFLLSPTLGALYVDIRGNTCVGSLGIWHLDA